MRTKQVSSATNALIDALILEIVVLAGERSLGFPAPGNHVLLRGENLTPLIIVHTGILYILILKLMFLVHYTHFLHGTHGPLSRSSTPSAEKITENHNNTPSFLNLSHKPILQRIGYQVCDFGNISTPKAPDSPLMKKNTAEQTHAEAASLPAGSNVTVAGYVICHQMPATSKGHVFLTIEDEEGLMNLVIRPDIYEKYRYVERTEPLMIVKGKEHKRDGVVNIIASHLEPLMSHTDPSFR
jgi:hypothetical protein